MTAQELKNSILMRAVSGKLVPQDSNDEPASVLLAKIRAEKEQMMKAGKIKKEPISEIYVDPSDNQHYEKVGDTVKCIEEEIPFEIPEGWAWIRLGFYIDIARGGSPRPIKAYLTEDANGINWIKIGDTEKDGKYINSCAEKIIPDGMSKSRFVKKGDFLLTNSMSFGRPYILNIDGCIHDGWLVFSSWQSIFEQEYLYYMLSSKFAYNQFCSKVSGAVVKNLNIDKVVSSIFPIPPLPEQKRIVKRIKEIEPCLEKYTFYKQRDSMLEDTLLPNLKKSLLQYAVQGKLVKQNPDDEPASVLLERIKAEKEQLIKDGKLKRDKNESYIYRGSDNSYYEKFADGKEICIDDEIPYELPLTWEWVRLRHIGEIIGGGTPATSVADYWDGEIPWLTPADMKNIIGLYVKSGSRNITELGLEKSSARLMPQYTILYSSRAPIGYIAIADNDICTNQGFKSINLYVKEMHKFIYYSLIHRTDDIKRRASGTTFKEISGSEFGNTLIPIPPLCEQKHITKKYEEIVNTL